ncbi:MAG TPA: hypothetical protein ENK24_01035 [Anaerolineae bacterium]|nr:hypothetical protein [Anaerolineae bacterium]
MAKQSQRIFWSVMLILFGIFFLLDNFRLVPPEVGDLFWTGIFGVGALFGLIYYLSHREQWWILFPTFTFFGITGVMFVESLPFYLIDGGSVFLFTLSLAFWILFVTEKQRWWAAIPAGALTSIAALAAVESAVHTEAAGLLFIGLGLTFGLLWLIRRESPTGWAKWPAMILLFLGFFFPVIPRLGQAWPLILIVIGVWMLFKAIKHNKNKSATSGG